MDKPKLAAKGREIFAKTGVFREVYGYLTTADLVLLARVCKCSLAAVNSVFRDRLAVESNETPADGADCLRLYKELHFKSVIILPLSALDARDKVDVFSGAKITKRTLFVDRLVQHFRFGIKFVAYHFAAGDLALLTKVDYLQLTKEELSKAENCRSVSSVHSFSVDARQLTYLDTDRCLKAIYYLKGKRVHAMPEIRIAEQVADYILNYSYLAYRTESCDFFLYSKYSDMNLGQAVKHKIIMPDSDYSMCLSGLNFYISDCKLSKLYCANLNALDPVVMEGDTSLKHLQMSEWSLPCRKPIVSHFAGLRNEIIICQDKYIDTKDWSNEDVREWFKNIGIWNIDNILKYDRFTGEHLDQIDKNMMVERFGIKNTDVHNKIMSEIKLEQIKTNHKPKLFGIGCNADGQLCVSNVKKNVSLWEQIKFLELSNTDFIKDIQFGWKNTLILTQEGRMFLSYKKPRKRIEDSEIEVEILRTAKNHKFSEKRVNRKYSEALTNYNSNEGAKNQAPMRIKKGSKKGEEMYMSDEDSNDSDEYNDSLPGKKNRKKKKGFSNKIGRGIKKERKYSYQSGDLKKYEDEGLAKWVEITNLFQINKYS